MDEELKTTAGTQALVDLEDAEPSILWETVNGSETPLWPQVRMEFSLAMAETELNSIAIPTRVSRAQAYSRLARAHLPSRQDATRFPAACDLLFIVGGATVFEEDGATRNWLIDDFASAAPGRVAVAQTRPLAGLPPFLTNTRSLDLAHGRVDLAARLRPAPEAVLREVDKLLSQFARLLDTDIPQDRVAAIAQTARYQESRRRHLEDEYARMLDRVQPSIVVMEDGSYGSRAPYISLMKRRGIRVVELQHGWIGPSHAAYNYGAAGRSEQFLSGMPDVLLTFGEYWSRNIRYPAQTVPIGKPQIDAKSADAPAYDSRPYEVAVISSIAEPEETAEFTLRLRDALPEPWTVLFRPHPGERSHFAERYPRLAGAPRIRMDDNRDVLDSLRRVRGVVGVASTVLYEALAMGPHVFVRDSPFAAYYAGEQFGNYIRDDRDIGVLVHQLTDGRGPTLRDAELDAVWHPKPVGAFVEFVGGV